MFSSRVLLLTANSSTLLPRNQSAFAGFHTNDSWKPGSRTLDMRVWSLGTLRLRLWLAHQRLERGSLVQCLMICLRVTKYEFGWKDIVSQSRPRDPASTEFHPKMTQMNNSIRHRTPQIVNQYCRKLIECICQHGNSCFRKKTTHRLSRLLERWRLEKDVHRQLRKRGYPASSPESQSQSVGRSSTRVSGF